MKLEQWLGSELGQTIWKNKYQQNGETLDQWFSRVSGGDIKLEELIVNKQFLFGGRILASRGINDRKVTYSNCYVLDPVEDSIEGIYDTAKHLARTFSYGGGCGIDISKLRPEGAEVHNAAKTTTGPVSFMSTFSQVSETIGQSGRRGALMISMDCNHQDIEKFIDAKIDTTKLEGCNISVKMTDEFMQTLYSRPECETDEHRIKLFKKLSYNNWNYAEPGILYWDTIKRYNLLSEYIKEGSFEYAGVNPCAEEPLPAGGSCLLGALNLSEFVEDPFTSKPAFNVPKFKSAVKVAVRALNDVLDEGLDLHPLPIQKECVRDWRQIGLGIMGFADMLIKLGIPYGSERSLTMIKTIGYAMNEAGLLESSKIAKEKGSFAKFDGNKILDSTFMEHITSNQVKQSIYLNGLRNSQLFTIAPTGSISTMLGVSGGVEPLFDIKYTRTTKSLNAEETTYEVFTPIVQQCIMELNCETMPDFIVCSKTINPFDRVKVQGAWQQYIDASISSTVNLHNDVTPEVIGDLYAAAWEVGCKGLTIYRDGCAREGILKSTPVKQPEPNEVPNSYHNDVELDTDIGSCIAKGMKLQTGCGSLWMTAYFHKVTGQLCHVFLNKGSQGGCMSYMNATSRLISGWAKDGASVAKIADQLESSVGCPSYAAAKVTKDNISKGKSCPSAVGKALIQLEKEFKAETYTTEEIKVDEECEPYNVTCPTCGSVLNFTGGCNICPDCGWSKCD